MTRQGAPTPPPHPPTDAEYVRKLALAILGTLQNKGLLSAEEVDSILIAARRAVQEPRSKPTPEHREPRPPQITVQPAPAPGTLSWQVVPPPTPEQAEAAQPRDKDSAPAEDEKHPPVIDFKLD